VDLVAPAPACATAAVARITGSIGLLVSAGLEAGVALSPAEIKALLRDTVDDVWLTEAELAEIDTWPSKEGWDAYYGYGRVNIGEAMERLVAMELSPEVVLQSPRWFDWPDPDALLEVEGRVAAPKGGTLSWTVDVGTGLDPRTWTTVASGSGPADGVLAEVDLAPYGDTLFADLDQETPVDRLERAHQPLVTIRVTASGVGGNAEERRGVWVHRDPDLLPGFPVQLGASLEGNTVLADLDEDGVMEIVAAGSDGRVHVLDGTGEERSGFPASTDITAGPEGLTGSAAVGDIDGDGVPEVVAASMQGGVYAWDPDGDALAPALGDVDRDGDLEIVVAAMDQRLYVWDDDGTPFPDYPLDLCLNCEEGFRIMSSPALGDIDGDGDLDAAIGTNEVPPGSAGLAFLVDLESATVWDGWPLRRPGLVNEVVLPLFGEGHPSSIGLADVDGDGDLELSTNAVLGTEGLIHDDGTTALELGYVADRFGPNSNVDDGSLLPFATNPAFGDLDADGVPDVFVAGSSAMYLLSLALTRSLDFQHSLGGWSGATGEALPGFPRQVDDVSFLNGPTVADLSGDEAPEVIYGSGGHFLYAWDAEGNAPEGWPKFTGAWVIGGGSVGDVDGDGWLEVVACTRDGWLFAWRTEGRADQEVQWASMFHDAANTGNYHTPLPVQEGPSGCCQRRNKPRSGASAILLLPLLWRRRRFGAISPANRESGC
jgi:hypothetical protein